MALAVFEGSAEVEAAMIEVNKSEDPRTLSESLADPRKRPDWKQLTHEFQTVLLLGAVLDKIEEVRCCTIDVESELQGLREVVKYA